MAAAFVPGGKGTVTTAAAAVGSTLGVASIGVGVATKDAATFSFGVAGHYTSAGAYLLEGTKGLLENLTPLGKALAIGQAGWDVIAAVKEGGCFGGGK